MENYLYHYTSVETLALILKNKTIRLNSLSNMDDLEEGNTKDFGNVGRFIYISSWTDDSKESIPLWNLYTPDMTGVRIGLPKNIFDTEILKADNQQRLEDALYTKGLLDIQSKNPVTFMPYQVELVNVTYTEDESLLYPNVFSSDNEYSHRLETKSLGRFKRKDWSFQKEWRYRLSSYPFSLMEFKKIVEMGRPELIFEELRKRESLGYVDVPIKEDLLENLVILYGPKVSIGQRIIIQDLVDKYNPTAKIFESSLKIR